MDVESLFQREYGRKNEQPRAVVVQGNADGTLAREEQKIMSDLGEKSG